jgi:hypothetical protein
MNNNIKAVVSFSRKSLRTFKEDPNNRLFLGKVIAFLVEEIPTTL